MGLVKYLNRDICLQESNDECTIAITGRLYAWIYVTVVFMCDKHNVELRDKQKRTRKKCQNALSKHLPPAWQQIISRTRIDLF